MFSVTHQVSWMQWTFNHWSACRPSCIVVWLCLCCIERLIRANTAVIPSALMTHSDAGMRRLIFK